MLGSVRHKIRRNIKSEAKRDDLFELAFFIALKRLPPTKMGGLYYDNGNLGKVGLHG